MLMQALTCAVRACRRHHAWLQLPQPLTPSMLPEGTLIWTSTTVRCMGSGIASQAAAAQEQVHAHLLPRVAIVGRPNVGKSALFNRLLRRRAALVLNTPESHVTRDWREGTARLGDLIFKVADTSGLEPDAELSTITGRAAQLTQRMLQSAHVTLMVVDAKSGIVAQDEELARWLSRAFPRPDRVFVVANKAEGARAREGMDQTVADCYRLGFGEPVAVSATTGEGMTDLYTALQPHIDEVRGTLEAQYGVGSDSSSSGSGGSSRRAGSGTSSTAGTTAGSTKRKDAAPSGSLGELAMQERDEAEEEGEEGGVSSGGEQDQQVGSAGGAPIRLAIMGLPNAGKSTLVNALLGEERVLTGPEPGLTRDSVAAGLQWKGVRLELVDTAGYIGQTKAAAYDDVGGDVAEAARGTGLRTLASSHVVLLVLDAAEAKKTRVVLRARELALVSRVASEGKALVVAANKMDILAPGAEREAYLSTLCTRLEEQMHGAGSPVLVELSARDGKGLDDVMAAAVDAFKAWNERVSTGRLNRLVRDLAAGKSDGGGGGAGELKRLKYMAQVGVRPPTFLAFLTGQDPVTDTFPRYLATAMRGQLGLSGTPLRFRFRYKASRREERARRSAVRRLVLSSAAAQDAARGPRVSASGLMAQRAKLAAREHKGLAASNEGMGDDGGEVEGREQSGRWTAGEVGGRSGRQLGGQQVAAQAGSHAGRPQAPTPRSISEEMREAAAARDARATEHSTNRAGPIASRSSRAGQAAEGRLAGGPQGRGKPRAPGATAGASQGRGKLGRAALMAHYLQRVARSPTAPLTHVQAAPRKARKAKKGTAAGNDA